MRCFSVIIPLYNKAGYVARCLESVQQQRYGCFEIIVVDDGSTDNSAAQARAYVGSNTRLIGQANQGVSVARNTGVANAHYDYVVFIDADDSWEPGFLDELNSLIDRYPEAGVYGINHYHSYANGKRHAENYTDLLGGREQGLLTDYFKIFAEKGKSPFSNSGCCYPVKVFNEMNGYTPGVAITEDSELWCKIALRYPVAFSNRPLAVYYLETPDNTRSLSPGHDYRVSQTLQHYLDRQQVPEHFESSVRHLIAFQQVSLIKRAILTGNRATALRKSFDRRVIRFYALTLAKLCLLALLPHRLFIRLYATAKQL